MTDFKQEIKQRRNKNLKISENFHDVEVIPTTSDAPISNEVQKLGISEADRCKRLQKLSCIALSPEEEKKLGKQLTDIIGFLGKLPDPKFRIQNSEFRIAEAKLSLRTIAGIKESSDSKKILKNVKHAIVNNSIVIKSVLN